MINPEVLLTDLKRLLGLLEGDLRERADEVPTLGESLRSAYERAKQAERTAQPFETWSEEHLTQVAAAWILACVFVRFIEDNGLIDAPLLAGSGPRLDQAKDQRTLYFQQHPTDSDREYLYYVFRKVEALPAAAPLFDERHNPLWTFGVSGDGATLLIEFWQRIDPATGALAHNFADPSLNTRFLGDLYQDLSEAARKKYALLQTPEFVEEFILDRTLTPAIAEFGLAEVRLIDPACGSGHFLLGAFHRLLHEWQKREPAVNVRELVQRALGAVYGVDLNPYAVAIARFRLLIAALKASDVHRLADAPAFNMNLATGDSLLHGPRPGGERQIYLEAEADPLRHVYDTEDADELRRILGARFQVVVGNPPYITVKDKALNDAYRKRFGSCRGKYSLAVPFLERFFDLALEPSAEDTGAAGYVGTITANSFMKREFGKTLVEEYIPRWDLTHVVDSSGAWIPGHNAAGQGTTTAILFGRHRKPVSSVVRAVLGIRGEPGTPTDGEHGLVWTSIVTLIDSPGTQNEFISVTDMAREAFHSHPWSIGGGGAAELKAELDSAAITLGSLVEAVGVMVVTGEDDVYVAEVATLLRWGIAAGGIRPFVEGDSIRDWVERSTLSCLYPHDDRGVHVTVPGASRHLWPYRSLLSAAVYFGRTKQERGMPWGAFAIVVKDKLRARPSIAFAFMASHNHFVLERLGKVFKQTAPVIKLAPTATYEEHVELVALLNTSVACFWGRQTFYPKGGFSAGKWEERLEWDSTKLRTFPIPQELVTLRRFGRALDRESTELAKCMVPTFDGETVPSRTAMQGARERAASSLARMVAFQEELDWTSYALYGLLAGESSALSVEPPPPLQLGERAFEVVMARKVASGDLETSWFERHGSVAITELPSHWTEQYRRTVESRIALIDSNPSIALIEQPEHKRRWNVEPWEAQEARALRGWLLSRLEAPENWPGPDLTAVSKLADRARRDPEFMQVAELYRGRADFDVSALVAELVEPEAVPFLSVLRYRSTGLRKRAVWERTWHLQRRVDAKEEVNEIPMPPKYTSADFLDSAFWRLRGKLDVPKERFISYPHAEREADQTLVIGWAGWDRLQQAKALAAYYVRMKEQEGWAPARLQPLVAGLLELIPWLKQWHNDLDPTYGIGMGDYFAGFVDEEARALGFTLDEVRAWQPPARNPRRRRRASV